MPSKPIKSNQNSTFIQPTPGITPNYIGDCVAIGDIPSPIGGKTLIQCVDEYGKGYKTIGDKRDMPGTIDFSIENLRFPAKGWLEELACPFTVFVTQQCDGRRGTFNNWIRASAVRYCDITNDTLNNVAQREAQDPQMQTVDVSGWPPRYDFREMTHSRITTAEVQNGLSITKAGIDRCGDSCGAPQAASDILLIGSVALGGATANVMRSADGGLTWAATAADPHAIGCNLVSVRAFMVGGTTVRYLVLRNTLAATALQIAYSDDAGVSWTTVTLGATVAEAGVADQSLCVLDEKNMWACTAQGRVYKSINGAVTWTEQPSALTAGGAAALNAIHFVDENIGFAVGAAGLNIYTIDGGTNWAAATATGALALNSVQVISRYRVIAGGATGSLYQTWNGGVTWTAITGWVGAGAGAVKNIKFANELVGFMVVDTAAPVGWLFRTIDGGANWLRHTNPVVNTGLNAIVLTGAGLNSVMGTGNAVGALQYVLKASG
jgi:photosystem II stability/assembly factor-like uncharacterized protein